VTTTASSGIGDGLGGADGDGDAGVDVGIAEVAGVDVGVSIGVVSSSLSLEPPQAVANEIDATRKTTTWRMRSDGTDVARRY
jgi:hypothetical protein